MHDVTFTFPDLTKMDAKRLMTALHQFSPQIAVEVEQRIRERTSKDTGALRESIASEAYTGRTTTAPLVDFYADSGPQEAEWGRFYAPYQEGPPIGESTYTNGPVQMFAQVATQDTMLIGVWASMVIQAELDTMVNEANAAATLIGP